VERLWYPDAEEALEQATLALFQELGWQTANAYDEVYGEAPVALGGGPYLGRATRADVILRPRVLGALAGLNPGLPPEAYEAAIEELSRDRSAMTLAAANRDIYAYLKDGLPVTFRGPDGEERFERLRLVDWDDPANNDFLLVRQFWVTGEVYTRRADLVGFVNGLPLLFGELKAHHRRVEDAYRNNLKDYKDTVPHFFWYNALILLSNGSDARLGTITAEWEHFAPWKKTDDEHEPGVISLETALRGTCPPARFLDLVENYLIFQEVRGGLAKIAAKYHQYLGVEQAIDAVRSIRDNQGRLGVFWHTQGSGKSIAMIFFCQKVLRKLPGNWSFLLLTDRLDLHDQLYKNFCRAGVVTEPEQTVCAQSGEHLQQLLREDHRYLFTLIQKFGTRAGARHPKVSDRSDIVVITDEAHRSQYDVLAMNMRDALPNAAFLAFTATPLIVGEERTRHVFGDYVTVYSYRQSNEDNATVPLYYENRIPELQLTNQDLNTALDRLLEEAEVDDAQERALAREFAREYHLITREDRLERIAEDIVDHFIKRGHLGKGMVVSIDRLTAVKMYHKVQACWQRARQHLQQEITAAAPEAQDALLDRLSWVQKTDMAVVISQAQGEVELFRDHGLDILPHRRRMVSEDLDEKFKDPDDPFRLVFVCAMWRTGFDVPCCSTIYLDRPMRNHTLMQTIARANRVFSDKVNGLIVDYVGIFRDLQRALAIYGTGPGGEIVPGEEPIQDKDALVEQLRQALAKAEAFCSARGIDLQPILHAQGFPRIALMDDAVEKVLVNDALKDQFLAHASAVDQFFKAILPDPRAGDLSPKRHLLTVLAAKIRALAPIADISDLIPKVETVLDGSVATREYAIPDSGIRYDLSKVDFEALKEQFERGRKHTEAERLRQTLSARLRRMVHLNRSRMDYLATFQRLIDDYNAGAGTVEQFFEQLLRFARQLDQEDQRALAENLSEEELAVFDLITRPKLALSDWDVRQIKLIARELLATLKRDKLVLDWRNRQQTRAAVQVSVKDWIWQLPECFTEDMLQQKSALIYQHVYDHYWGAWQARQSVYALPV
jgi:type I restriction enzyme R subunit